MNTIEQARQALIDCLPKVGEPEAQFCTVLTADLRAVLAQPAAPAKAKQWPFVETPAEFAHRLHAAAIECGDMVAAIRNVLIENPPTYRTTPQPAPEGKCPTCGSDCNERDELIKAEREIEKLRAALAQPAAPAQEVGDAANNFLLVAMDDGGFGTPIFCRDKSDVSRALLPLMFFLQPGERLSPAHTEEFDANLEELMDTGCLQFEGDPSIYLYRIPPTALYTAPQPAAPAQADDWRKYATEREDTAQAVIERHRKEHEALLRLLAADRREIERLKEAQWQAVGHALQPVCRYISDVLASDASSGEKRIARTAMMLLPGIQSSTTEYQPTDQASEQPKPRTDVVPGKVHCAKCGFTLLRTNLYVRSGTTGPGDERTEPCPNDGNPLLPITWEQEAREAWATCESQIKRAVEAEEKLERAFSAGMAEGFNSAQKAPATEAVQPPSDAQILAAARALNKINADARNVDESDNWKLYGDSQIIDARIILRAARHQAIWE